MCLYFFSCPAWGPPSHSRAPAPVLPLPFPALGDGRTETEKAR